MKYILLGMVLLSSCITAKVLIITHSYNRPEFIEIHAQTFKKFLKDDYEYVVFNDAPTDDMYKKIKQTCKKLKIKHMRIPQHLHDFPGGQYPGYRHMVGIQYSFEQMGFDHNGIVMLIDSDMFLIKPFSVEEYLKGYDIAGQLQGRKNEQVWVQHISPALAFMNMSTLPNKRTLSFYGGNVEGLTCDVGGRTYYYFQNNPSVRLLYFGLLHIGAWKVGLECKLCSNMTCQNCLRQLVGNKFDDAAIKFIHECPDDVEFFLEHTFLHYRSGSNWDNKPAEYHRAKASALNNLLAAVMH